jgi:hypothetical protein
VKLAAGQTVDGMESDGILGTRWKAEFEGHKLVVSRKELARGFKLEWDGVDIAHRCWSLLRNPASEPPKRDSVKLAHERAENESLPGTTGRAARAPRARRTRPSRLPPSPRA